MARLVSGSAGPSLMSEPQPLQLGATACEVVIGSDCETRAESNRTSASLNAVLELVVAICFRRSVFSSPWLSWRASWRGVGLLAPPARPDAPPANRKSRSGSGLSTARSLANFRFRLRIIDDRRGQRAGTGTMHGARHSATAKGWAGGRGAECHHGATLRGRQGALRALSAPRGCRRRDACLGLPPLRGAPCGAVCRGTRRHFAAPRGEARPGHAQGTLRCWTTPTPTPFH